MKKIVSDSVYFKAGLALLLVVLCSILFEKFIGNIDVVFDSLTCSVKFISNVLQPFIFGFFIAYFLNSIVHWLETTLFNKSKYRRIFSVLVTYIVFIGCLIWIVMYLLPELSFSVQKFALLLPNNINHIDFNKFGILNNVLDMYNNNFGTKYTVSGLIKLIVTPLTNSLESLPNLINTVLTQTVGFARNLLNLLLGVVIAFYMLCEKERFASLCTKLVYIFFKKPVATNIVKSTREYNCVFKNFIVGKSIDSMIIGLMFFIICQIIHAPYVLLISLIIGVTNMIPYFGPLIGAIPVVLIVMISNPGLSLWVALIIFILQQFDGIILGPKILGDSTGLGQIEVIFAIIIGGATFGVWGMFFGVPVFAVISRIISSLIDQKYAKVNEK